MSASVSATRTASRDRYAEIVDALVVQLEAGCAPWVRPWSGGPGLPTNLATQRQYRGINILWLWTAQSMGRYERAEWLSFKQARALGGTVRKGESGVPIVFFRLAERDDVDAPEGVRRIPILRTYTVFNRAQCDGLPSAPDLVVQPEFVRLADVDAFLARVGATVTHGGDRAFYERVADAITMPSPERFKTPDAYYATSLHEHAHWSGAPHRLAREFGKRFGDHAYAAEELVAELTAAFLCAELGIAGELRHAEYLASWVRALREEPRILLTAGARASDAADYLAGLAGRRTMQLQEAGDVYEGAA